MSVGYKKWAAGAIWRPPQTYLVLYKRKNSNYCAVTMPFVR